MSSDEKPDEGVQGERSSGGGGALVGWWRSTRRVVEEHSSGGGGALVGWWRSTRGAIEYKELWFLGGLVCEVFVVIGGGSGGLACG